VSTVQAVVESRPRHIVYVAGYAAIVGALSVVLGIRGIADGETPAIGRAVLGVVGVVGAYLLWTRPKIGWMVLLAWAALQIPYVAWNTDGSPLSQVIYFPLSIINETRRSIASDAQIVSYSEFGINLIGIALTIVVAKWRKEWLYRNQ
jgi:hypothetical protein